MVLKGDNILSRTYFKQKCRQFSIAKKVSTKFSFGSRQDRRIFYKKIIKIIYNIFINKKIFIKTKNNMQHIIAYNFGMAVALGLLLFFQTKAFEICAQ